MSLVAFPCKYQLFLAIDCFSLLATAATCKCLPQEDCKIIFAMGFTNQGTTMQDMKRPCHL